MALKTMRARASELEHEGYKSALAGEAFDANPYLLRSKEWEMWRLGWAHGDYVLWQGVLMDKRKASTE